MKIQAGKGPERTVDYSIFIDGAEDRPQPATGTNFPENPTSTAFPDIPSIYSTELFKIQFLTTKKGDKFFQGKKFEKGPFADDKIEKMSDKPEVFLDNILGSKYGPPGIIPYSGLNATLEEFLGIGKRRTETGASQDAINEAIRGSDAYKRAVKRLEGDLSPQDTGEEGAFGYVISQQQNRPSLNDILSPDIRREIGQSMVRRELEEAKSRLQIYEKSTWAFGKDSFALEKDNLRTKVVALKLALEDKGYFGK